MMKKTISAFVILALSGLATAAYVKYESHEHNEFNAPVVGHGGGLDSRGGHNCSEKSKRKGLCSGYHYHR